MTQLTEQQAYAAMFAFLDNFYDMTKSDDIGALLGSMALLPGGQPLDAAFADDWRAAVDKALAGTVKVHVEFRPNAKAWRNERPGVLRRLFLSIVRRK